MLLVFHKLCKDQAAATRTSDVPLSKALLDADMEARMRCSDDSV